MYEEKSFFTLAARKVAKLGEGSQMAAGRETLNQKGYHLEQHLGQ